MSKPIRRERDSNGNLKPYSRCRYWELQISVCEAPGRYRKRSRRFRGTYREACDELARFRVQVENERPKSGWLCSKWLDGYVERKKKTAARSTIKSLERAKNQFLEHTGDKPLESITAKDIAKWRDSLLVEYNPKTVQQRMMLIRPAFDDAVRRDILPSNPFSRVDAPKITQVHREALSVDQIERLVAMLDFNDGVQRALLLCLLCGLRRGEVCALTWDCLNDDVLTIRKSINDRGDVVPTKNKKIREVPVPPNLSALLDSSPRDCEYVCTRGGGLAIHPHYLNKWWVKHRKDYGCDEVRIHDLRHAYVTQLCRDGVNPRVIQALVGHSDINITMQVYAHVDMEQRREAAARLDGLFAADLRHSAHTRR